MNSSQECRKMLNELVDELVIPTINLENIQCLENLYHRLECNLYTMHKNRIIHIANYFADTSTHNIRQNQKRTKLKIQIQSKKMICLHQTKDKILIKKMLTRLLLKHKN